VSQGGNTLKLLICGDSSRYLERIPIPLGFEPLDPDPHVMFSWSAKVCIGGYWASSSVSTCPLCKRQFDERPQLSINKVFALIADKYKQTHYGATGFSAPLRNGSLDPMEDSRSTNPFLSPSLAAVAPEDVVWCDVCSGVKQPATSSCLTCTASYCNEHLQPHYNTPFYAKHPLMDPQEALRGRTCSIHRRLMEARANTSSEPNNPNQTELKCSEITDSFL
ncbi:hypothetical protein GOODEAATRI_018809, partial [Goodea atripinnis]